MTKFVMRGGHMVSTERAAILDGLAPGETAPTPIRAAAAPEQQMAPPRPRSERLADPRTPAQKRAATRAANLAAAAAAKAEPLRPRNIDPATGEEVVLKEVKDENGDIKQVRVEDPTVAVAISVEDGEVVFKDIAGDGDDEDPFDAAVEAAAGAGAAAPAGEADASTESDEADALADA